MFEVDGRGMPLKTYFALKFLPRRLHFPPLAIQGSRGVSKLTVESKISQPSFFKGAVCGTFAVSSAVQLSAYVHLWVKISTDSLVVCKRFRCADAQVCQSRHPFQILTQFAVHHTKKFKFSFKHHIFKLLVNFRLFGFGHWLTDKVRSKPAAATRGRQKATLYKQYTGWGWWSGSWVGLT